MGLKSRSAPEKWILAGIPALFLIGSVLHFAHQLLGQNPVAGLFFPVNESVWEHCKMVLLPVILWWSTYYCCRGKKHGISKDKWFSAALWPCCLHGLPFHCFSTFIPRRLVWNCYG